MSFLQKLKALRRKFSVLGNWGDYNQSWLMRVRSDHEHERLLDAGCGQGQVRDFFKQHNALIDYYGIDLTVGDASWDFKVSAVADLHQIPFKNKSFDKIICTTVLEHVANPIKVMGEFSRVLRPSGRLHLMVPMVWHLHQQPHDHFRFTKHSLNEFARRYDLSVEKLEPIGGYFTVLRYMFGLRFVSENNGPVLRFLSHLVNPFVKIIDAIFVAPLCYVLDTLDRDKNLTVGYFVSYRKNGTQENLSNGDNPYQCPSCGSDQFKVHSTHWLCGKCQTSFRVENKTPKLIVDSSYQMAHNY